MVIIAIVIASEYRVIGTSSIFVFLIAEYHSFNFFIEIAEYTFCGVLQKLFLLPIKKGFGGINLRSLFCFMFFYRIKIIKVLFNHGIGSIIHHLVVDISVPFFLHFQVMAKMRF